MPQTKLKSICLGTAAAILVSSVAIPAQATTPLYSGGGTLAEKVYRDIMNCYGNHGGGAAPGDTTAFLSGAPTGCNTVTPYNSNVEPLYVGVGSGNGKKGFVTHNAAFFTFNGSAKKPDRPPVPSTTDFGPFYSDGTGTQVGTGWTADATGTAPGFPKVSFVGSDDPLSASDVSTYNTNSNGWGAPIQFPGLITTVSIPYNPASGTWTEKGKAPAGGGQSGLVDLSLNTLCGIFNGDINSWNDPAITKDNNNVVLGTGTIYVVYRSDGSGTTFLTSNALIHQCAGTSHPISSAWQTTGGNVAGVGNNSFFVDVGAGLPANFHGASGSGAVKTAILSNPGSIGYLSPDFVLPIDTSTTLIGGVPTASPKAANLQTWASASLAKPVFKAPTAKNGGLIVGPTKAPLFTKNSCSTVHSPDAAPFLVAADGVCAHNPLNWGLAFPQPTSAGAYPIGGFTFIDTYTCYAAPADVTALVGTTAGSLGFLRWFNGTAADNGSLVKNQLTANGFSLAPGGWLAGAKKLLTTDLATKVSTPGTLKTGCANVHGTGA